MESISYLVRYASRLDWGADTRYPRLGYLVPVNQRDHLIFHHTVGVDNDISKNVWETDAECFANMRMLQVVRPDLGLDVPYTDVIYLMRKNGFPALLICEGRGHKHTGAHTSGHNTRGIGAAFAGDSENFPTDLNPWVGGLSQYAGWLKYDKGMSNLGNVNPPGLSLVYGHRDLYATACPGKGFYDDLKNIKFTKPT